MCIARLRVRKVYVDACVHPCVSQLSREHTRRSLKEVGGEGLIAGPLARELVRQLLTGLSHPAREKDHLARRADISNDTAVQLPLPSLPLPSLFLLDPPGPGGPDPYPGILAPSLPALNERVGHADVLRLLPRGAPRARFGNCTRFAASSYPPCRGAFLRKAPLANSDFVKSLLLRCTPCFPFLHLPFSLLIMTAAHVCLPEAYHRSS